LGGLFLPLPALANGLHIPICAPFAALAATKTDSPKPGTYFRQVPKNPQIMNYISKGIILIFFLTSVLAACSPDQENGANQESRPVLTSDGHSVRLSPEQIAMGGIELGQPEQRRISVPVECTGMVDIPPYSQASVYSPVNGFVQSVRHLPGDFVKKGTLLTTVKHPDLIRLQREFLESKGRLTFIEKDFQRKTTLAGLDAASQKVFDQAESDLMVEQARYNGLKAELELIGIDVRQIEKTGGIQQAINLYAPINGFVTKVNVNTGKLVTPSDLLFELIDKSHMHLELQVFAKDVDKIKKGQRIECVMPGRDRPVYGDVHLVGQMIDPETKTTMVHGHLENESVSLVPGAFIKARIYVDDTQVLTVPATAIVREGEDRFLFVLRNGAFEKVQVVAGKTDGEYIEIQPFGLKEGEQIAVKGAYYINGSALGGEE
jgi:membrane fusion protein, heavy metal efflux system